MQSLTMRRVLHQRITRLACGVALPAVRRYASSFRNLNHPPQMQTSSLSSMVSNNDEIRRRVCEEEVEHLLTLDEAFSTDDRLKHPTDDACFFFDSKPLSSPTIDTLAASAEDPAITTSIDEECCLEERGIDDQDEDSAPPPPTASPSHRAAVVVEDLDEATFMRVDAELGATVDDADPLILPEDDERDQLGDEEEGSVQTLSRLKQHGNGSVVANKQQSSNTAMKTTRELEHAEMESVGITMSSSSKTVR